MQMLLNEIVVVVDVNTEAGDKENKQTNKQKTEKTVVCNILQCK